MNVHLELSIAIGHSGNGREPLLLDSRPRVRWCFYGGLCIIKFLVLRVNLISFQPTKPGLVISKVGEDFHCRESITT